MRPFVRPALLVHADWSKNPAKRIMVMAVLANGRYLIHEPLSVGNLADWLPRLEMARREAGSIFIGVDFPIGLPRKYAQKAGIENYLDWLPQTAVFPWSQFYEVAETVDEIGLKRPFYPNRPGGKRQQQLIDALGMQSMADLRRQCDFARPGRRAASPLFWTMGAQQVGKAAITGWRDFIVPSLDTLSIWPFAGELETLLSAGNTAVLAETYPGEIYDWLGVTFGKGGKGSRLARQTNRERFFEISAELDVVISRELERHIENGFASDDAFDAFVGVLGMLLIVLGKRPLYEPKSPLIRTVEGWILGQYA